MNLHPLQKQLISQQIPIQNEETLFNSERKYLWAHLLQTYATNSNEINDSQLFQIKNDIQNQRVIKQDCLRTRSTIFDSSEKQQLENFLTSYCKQQNLSYKQGLNEVGAIFVFLMRSNVSEAYAFNYFSLFMKKYLQYCYADEEFLSLQCCFHLFSQLMKYHDPNLFTYLNKNYISPELYATPWFLTLFASKLNLEIIYLLWDIYLLEDDPTFIFFISLALIIYHRQILLTQDTASVPQYLTQLTIRTQNEFMEIIQIALSIKYHTPATFFMLIEKHQLFSPTPSQQNLKTYLNLLENQICLQLMPLDLMYNIYPQDVSCCSDGCPSFYFIKRSQLKYNGPDLLNAIAEVNEMQVLLKGEKQQLLRDQLMDQCMRGDFKAIFYQNC